MNDRLIPAWAGKTTRVARVRGSREAHPRVGGENRRAGATPRTRRGSSPRGRGKRCIRRCLARTRLAHPRVGGENDPHRPHCGRPRGSSPRGRGKPPPGSAHRAGVRLIPAWAGKTRNAPDRCDVDPAHPRVGGENRGGDACGVVATGSSPRGRGKPLRGLQRSGPQGLIPAWAGKTK